LDCFTQGNCGFLERSRRLGLKYTALNPASFDCHLFLHPSYCANTVFNIAFEPPVAKDENLMVTSHHSTWNQKNPRNMHINTQQGMECSKNKYSVNLIIQYFKINIIIEFLDIIHHPVFI
jgi:hypothetical protein